MPVYFDNAATTRPCAAALDEFRRVSDQVYGNPSSLHALGIAAEAEIIAASRIFAELLHISPQEFFFTSGGTESNNLAVFGAAKAAGKRGNHIITTKIEHPSVTEAFKRLSSRGFEVTWLDVDENGQVDIAELERNVNDNTVLASFIHVNNETGSVLDVSALGSVVKAKNPKTAVHSDGVQAFCKHGISLKNIDLYSVSSHKIHGVKGVGGLFVRKNTRLTPMLYGGGQQTGIRPGTENPPGIAAFAAAAKSGVQSPEHVAKIKQKLAEAAAGLDNVHINGGNGSPYILNMSFCGVKAEVLLHILEAEEIYVSTGAACNSKSAKHNVLESYGISAERVGSALRFSFGGHNTIAEAERVKAALIENVIRQREIIRKR